MSSCFLPDSASSGCASPAAQWDTTYQQQLVLFFTSPQALKKTAKDAFLVMQANVYVTLALLRLVILSVFSPPSSVSRSKPDA